MRSDGPEAEAVKQYAVRLGDDALVLGHRLSEWCGRGPFLEEDLALTNTALDYIGRARMYYGYAAELSGGGCTEDHFAYRRDCREFTNLLIHELPRGDFAFTMARQFLVDVHGLAYLERLQTSSDRTLAAIAAKAVKESRYHLRRSREWMLRLGGGTGESRRRVSARWRSSGATPRSCSRWTRWSGIWPRWASRSTAARSRRPGNRRCGRSWPRWGSRFRTEAGR